MNFSYTNLLSGNGFKWTKFYRISNFNTKVDKLRNKGYEDRAKLKHFNQSALAEYHIESRSLVYGFDKTTVIAKTSSYFPREHREANRNLKISEQCDSTQRIRHQLKLALYPPFSIFVFNSIEIRIKLKNNFRFEYPVWTSGLIDQSWTINCKLTIIIIWCRIINCIMICDHN